MLREKLPLLLMGAVLGALGCWLLLSREAALALAGRGYAPLSGADGEVWTLAEDGAKLRAAVRETGAGERWVLLLRDREGGDMDAMAQAYRAAGWSTLIPDLRVRETGGGTRDGPGMGEREAVLAWLARLAELYPGAALALHGQGTGASTAIRAAGTRPRGLAAVVAEGLRRETGEGTGGLLALGTRALLPLLPGGEPSGSLRTETAGTRVPILFLQREGDGPVPAAMAADLCRCAYQGSRVAPVSGDGGLPTVFRFLTDCSAAPQTP